MAKPRSPLSVIFVTVFIDLVGFGIVIPILPLYAERSADEPHAVRAPLRRGDVGDIGHRRGDVAAGDAVNDAGEEQQPETVGGGHDEKPERGAENAHEQHRATAHAVGEFAQQRRAEALHERVDGEQHPDDEG